VTESTRIGGQVTERLSKALGANESDVIDAVDLVRYRWVAGFASGKRVLDAGCGLGFGASALVDAGAHEVVGVASSQAFLEAAQKLVRPDIRLEHHDVRHLPYDDGSFDLVVAFDVLRQFEDPRPVLAELARLVARDGVLAVSTAGSTASELSPSELRVALAQYFEHVRLFDQSMLVASAILDMDSQSANGLPIHDVEVQSSPPGRPGAAQHVIALASPGPLPSPPQTLLIGAPIEDRDQALLHAIERQAKELAELASLVEERRELGLRLEEAETRLARLLRVEQAIALAEDELLGMREALAEAQDQVLGMRRSMSWRITRPLRVVHAALTRRRR
jgi:SAM-dependent methyltransferase